MVDLKIYMQECVKMILLKNQDPMVQKVYSDVNFDKLLQKALYFQQYQEDLALAEKLFNVSQSENCSNADPENLQAEMRYN